MLSKKFRRKKRKGSNMRFESPRQLPLLRAVESHTGQQSTRKMGLQVKLKDIPSFFESPLQKPTRAESTWPICIFVEELVTATPHWRCGSRTTIDLVVARQQFEQQGVTEKNFKNDFAFSSFSQRTSFDVPENCIFQAKSALSIK